MSISIHQRVLSLLSQAKQINTTEVRQHDHLIEDLELDSLEIAELVALLRQAFSLQLTGICEPGCQTVSQIVHRIEADLRRARAA